MRPSLRVRLRALKVLLRKHIPEKYLRAAPWQRLALLQGLMDTDGSIGRNGHCEITLKDDQLAHDLGELLSSLGFKWRRQQRYVHRDGRRYGPYLRYHFTASSDFPVFRLSRKRDRLQPRPAKNGKRPASPHRCNYTCGQRASAVHSGRFAIELVPRWKENGADP
ncbi:MAG UNVERIFIED_CONTAM: hypothetical protein LVR18_19915 [Planctomycetaceae bacterium]